MSGTSLDGVDCCLAQLGKTGTVPVLQLEQAFHWYQPYPDALKQRLLSAQHPEATLTLSDVSALHNELGKLYAQTVKQCYPETGPAFSELFAVGCHGQTVFHQPPTKDQPLGHTLQLGDPAPLAQLLPCPVVSDFRPADIALGGHGAPLVPFADACLLANPDENRCIQNLGGIGNVTVLPGTEAETEPFAFDTGPANILLDAAAQDLLGKPYDEDGTTAAKGTVSLEALNWLKAHPYYQQTPPKSTGRELFNSTYYQEFRFAFPQLESADSLATLTELTAWSISTSYERFVLPRLNGPVHKVVLGGGGTRNEFLVTRLVALLSTVAQEHQKLAPQVLTHQQALGLNDSAKEALAFGLLAWARLLGLPNNLPSCTGASGFTSMGRIS